jgi:hypothetical protein
MSRAGTIAFHRSLSCETVEIITYEKSTSTIVCKPARCTTEQVKLESSSTTKNKGKSEAGGEMMQEGDEGRSDGKRTEKSNGSEKHAPSKPLGKGLPAEPQVSKLEASAMASIDSGCWEGCRCARGYMCWLRRGR